MQISVDGGERIAGVWLYLLSQRPTTEEFAIVLAGAKSDEQADVLNRLAEAAKEWPNRGQEQWLWIAKNLSPEALEMLTSIVEFAKEAADAQ